MKKGKNEVPRTDLTKSMMVHAILEDLYQKIFDEIAFRVNVSTKFANWEDQIKADKKLQRTFQDQLTRARTAAKERSKTSNAFTR